MASAATDVPAASQLLCEVCGYVVSGLPDDSRCPECGSLIAQSNPALRVLPTWERDPNRLAGFIRTTLDVLFRPSEFFRTLVTRTGRDRSLGFARLHWLATSVLFGVAALGHLHWMMWWPGIPQWALVVIFTGAGYAMFAGVNRLAAWLTHWEATYRGMRMPTAAVRRALDYHAAHYLPVALLAAATVWIFTALSDANKLSAAITMDYFYVLSGEVIVAATYLFWEYWTAMRNIMYANA